MRKGLTDITIILDRSGSMSSVATDTIGGFNRFLADQKSAPGEAMLSLNQFDHEYEAVYRAIDIKSAPDLTASTFVPCGNTALLDAIGRGIVETGKRLGDLADDQKPEHVIFVILTDGHENASKEFTRQKIFDSIKHQTEKYNWKFLFLGANQDAIAVGATIGIPTMDSLTYAANAKGTARAFESTSRVVTMARSGGNALYSTQDRTDQTNAGA